MEINKITSSYNNAFLGRPTNITKKQFVRLVNQGKTNTEIASILEVSRTRVNQLKHKYDLVQPKKTITPEEVKAFVEQGKTDAEISEISGLGIRTIAKIRSKIVGIKYPFKKKGTPNLNEQVKELAKKGLSISEIANIVGKSKCWISQLSKKLSVKIDKYKNLRPEIQKLFAQGKTLKEVASIYGKSIAWAADMKKKFYI